MEVNEPTEMGRPRYYWNEDSEMDRLGYFLIEDNDPT